MADAAETYVEDMGVAAAAAGVAAAGASSGRGRARSGFLGRARQVRPADPRARRPAYPAPLPGLSAS